MLSMNVASKNMLYTGSMMRGRTTSIMAAAPTSQQLPLLLRYKSTRPDLNRDTNNNSLLQYTAISDWFVQLRWKAAHMLTSSLSDKERQELLRRMNLPATSTASSTSEVSKTNDEENDSESKNRQNVSHSIAEAVAAARAQEIKLNQERWEREKEKLIRDAEMAARERIESDLLIQKRQIAFEQWKKSLADAAATTKEAPTEVVPQEAATTQVKVVEELHPHPILGPCVLDLGYKRLHVVKAQALAAIPVWEKQRIYRHDRAKTMAVDKLKTLHLGMPGVIGLYEHSDGKLSILDGQHRIGMFTILEGMKKDTSNSFLEQIVVEVYSKPPTNTDHETSSESSTALDDQQDATLSKEIFLEINKAEPVKLVDIPGIVKGSERKMLNDAVDQLYDTYPEMFRSSTKCHPPHVNIDNIRDAIFAANVMSRHKMKSTKQLYDWLVQQNTILGQKYNGKDNNNTDTGGQYTAKALEKAIKFQFYLGLESSWYYN